MLKYKGYTGVVQFDDEAMIFPFLLMLLLLFSEHPLSSFEVCLQILAIASVVYLALLL